MKRKKLNNFFYQKNGFQLANQPRKKKLKEENSSEGRQQQLAFRVDPFHNTMSFCWCLLRVPEEAKKKHNDANNRKHGKGSKTSTNRCRNKFFILFPKTCTKMLLLWRSPTKCREKLSATKLQKSPWHEKPFESRDEPWGGFIDDRKIF